MSFSWSEVETSARKNAKPDVVMELFVVVKKWELVRKDQPVEPTKDMFSLADDFDLINWLGTEDHKRTLEKLQCLIK